MRSAFPSPELLSRMGPCLISAGKRHELHGKELSCPDLSLTIDLDQDKVLEGERSADRDHHSAARLELLNQRRRNLARRRGDDNAVGQCRPLPTVIAVAPARCRVEQGK